jgi:hypothetical protein
MSTAPFPQWPLLTVEILAAVVVVWIAVKLLKLALWGALILLVACAAAAAVWYFLGA